MLDRRAAAHGGAAPSSHAAVPAGPEGPTREQARECGSGGARCIGRDAPERVRNIAARHGCAPQLDTGRRTIGPGLRPPGVPPVRAYCQGQSVHPPRRTPGTGPGVQMANQLGTVFAKLNCAARWRGFLVAGT
jgi:hypothetical protein